MSKTRKLTRRQFVQATGAVVGAAATMSPVPTIARGRLEKPTLLGIGAGGKGRSDLQELTAAGFDLVGLVDVIDAKKLASIQGRLKSMAQVRDTYQQVPFATDYREMLADLGDKVDAVVVSTPDHHHYHAAVTAMNAGKHVYVQKPLAHSIWEARRMAEVARETGLKTQMGNQAHANDHMRRCVELIRAGVVGKVQEMHTWTNRPIWAQGFATPPPKAKVPNGIDWNQWIGPAPWVDYSPLIAPFAWRGWWDFGTGALGDMACHIMDLGYWAMQPGAPQSVIASANGATEISPPINSKISWQFAPNQYSAKEGFAIHWYDGYVNASFNRESWKLDKESNEYNHPSEEVLDGMDFQKFGSVIIGEHGKLFFSRGGGRWMLKSDANVDGFEWPEESLPRAAGENNYLEFFDAVSGNVKRGESHFGLAGPMTETILLGVLAQRVPGETLEWNAKDLKIGGRPELNQYIRREYRDGWN